MNGGNFTFQAQSALKRAQSIAEKRGQQQVDALHLLQSLLSQDESIVLNLLGKFGIDINDLKAKMENALKTVPTLYAPQVMGNFYLTQDMAKVLEWAQKEAMEMGDEFVSIEHLFLGILGIGAKAGEILQNAIYLSDEGKKLDYQTALEALKEIRGGRRITDPTPETKYQVVKKYAINLTQLAKKGKLDPVIGREQEIRRLMQVLSRRRKNNPVLIGGAGVGKTAIAEGLAQRIIKSDVPESLKHKELISLDLGSLIAGTRYRGEFESRIKSLLREIKKSDGKYILFIDELHTLVGAGAAEGAIDASNLLKPALARGDLKAIGATTLKEYQKHVEKDPALERRFQPILVSEPTIKETVNILRGLKEKYELHHGVKITDKALVASAELAARYITDRFLPDKAVDLMDEAASALRLEIESEPKEIEELGSKIQKLEVERQVIKNKDKKQKISQELADLNEKYQSLASKWKAEKELIQEIKGFKKQIEVLSFQAEVSQREGNLQKAAEIKYGQIPELEQEIVKAEKKLTQIQEKHQILKEEIDAEDVGNVVSRWTGIPVNRLIEQEAKKLEKMEATISQRIIGQKKAVKAIANAIRRSRAGISEENRPLGSFMFLGPTGVGKTETARALAEFLFNDENALIRVDMSEYMERHTVSKMIGSPPGYVGYDEGGQLTEKIRRRPYSVVLLDEIEKAHPEVFNVLLQILEDGRLTDAKGRMVSFKNTILIMTSNVGSDYIDQMGDLGFLGGTQEKTQTSLKTKVLDALKQRFRPEFLNRVDDIIIFDYLSKQEIRKIVELELVKVSKRLKNSNIEISFQAKVKDLLAEKGFDHNLGARPLKRLIQKLILDPLALKIVRGEIKQRDRVDVNSEKSKIILQKKQINAKKKQIVNV